MPTSSTYLPAPTAFGGIAARVSSALQPKSRSGSPNPTGQPVRRNSKEAGTFEDQFWIEPDKGDTDRQVAALRNCVVEAKKLKRKERAGESLTRNERWLSRVTPAVVAVFEEIANLARKNAGRVFCGYAHLATITQLVDSTIAKALTVLEGLGMVDRQRRFTKIAAEGPKARYRQTSNAYRTRLPKVIAHFLPRWMKQKPMPADLAHHHAEQAAETERMLKSATCVEQMTYRAPESSDLRRELARLAATVDRCDFENT